MAPPRSGQCVGNEWGEQAVVEPSVQDGDEMLLAHRRAVEDVEKHVMEKHAV